MEYRQHVSVSNVLTMSHMDQAFSMDAVLKRTDKQFPTLKLWIPRRAVLTGGPADCP